MALVVNQSLMRIWNICFLFSKWLSNHRKFYFYQSNGKDFNRPPIGRNHIVTSHLCSWRWVCCSNHCAIFIIFWKIYKVPAIIRLLNVKWSRGKGSGIIWSLFWGRIFGLSDAKDRSEIWQFLICFVWRPSLTAADLSFRTVLVATE